MGLLDGVWTSVAAGASQTAAANGLYAVDTTGSRPTFTLPNAPADGTSFLVSFDGSSNANGVAFTAQGSDLVENPMIPGTFSAAAGTVVDTIVGDVVAYKYHASPAKWRRII